MIDTIEKRKTKALEVVTIENESFFKISNCDHLRPFLMSIVSDSDHWMFISSNGGLSAGRKNAEFALFPYYTEDKIEETAEFTGSKSIFCVSVNGRYRVWEPFSIRAEKEFSKTRNLYKNTLGNKVIFEEVNHDLELSYQYQWNSSNEFGFVRKSNLINSANHEVSIRILDGIQNILPSGVESDLQNASSNLVNAYKRNELQLLSGLGIFALSANIVDKAEPSEALKANVVWSLGLENSKHLLSSLQLEAFRNGESLTQEVDIKGEKGAYFNIADLYLSPKSSKSWMIIANVNQNHSAVTAISHRILTDQNLEEKVNRDIALGLEGLKELIASSDGMQCTSNELTNARHSSNVLFNIMRGGIFDDNYRIERWDFHEYVSRANKIVAANNHSSLGQLPETFSVADLRKFAYETKDQDLYRLSIEYLPLKFSRRHGDPSRPWNKFSINTRSEIDGSKILDYEGNWRDIFQNWEALLYSFPDYVEGMIYKFLNASTFDGYNPYRVTKGGFDWEVIEPDDPWSYIGYWGDHQIIYLLKFLEFIEDHKPGKLENIFTKAHFVYANVPYKIKSYDDMLRNAKDTIDFDTELNEEIEDRKIKIGADGALLQDRNKRIVKVNFIEKILATTLAKLSNFIPEGGIWMNTQRPEWNDANNALVGNGVSMVTLCYLRRFLAFFDHLLINTNTSETGISSELAFYFQAVFKCLNDHSALLTNGFDDLEKKAVLDVLCRAASDYRTSIYKRDFSGNKTIISLDSIKQFIQIALKYLDHSIRVNKRADRLYHAYNLITIDDDKISIAHLEEMLEGQVAVLSSKSLTSEEVVSTLNVLKTSRLFRKDQSSYLLYPNKELRNFLSRNTIPSASIERSDLLKKLLDTGNSTIIEKDINNEYHFNASFNNATKLTKVLERLENIEPYKNLVRKEKALVEEIYEEVFNHKAFTGRSGTFYGYEGLGSIYWHMVSKLRLAVFECCQMAKKEIGNKEILDQMIHHFYEISEGIGVHKTAKLYGAFPTDPYSHTPVGKGAQQPGMTGQVKEDIICRYGELGVEVLGGEIHFSPFMLRKDEFLKQTKEYKYVDIAKVKKSLTLLQDSLFFTYCQIPVIYSISQSEGISLRYKGGDSVSHNRTFLDKQVSALIFSRTGAIEEIRVSILESKLI